MLHTHTPFRTPCFRVTVMKCLRLNTTLVLKFVITKQRSGQRTRLRAKLNGWRYQPCPPYCFALPWLPRMHLEAWTRLYTIIKFINKPLSNFDLLNWVEQLGIKHFRGVFSRDNLPNQIEKKECGVINLDSQIGPGAHWVCYRNIDKDVCEYFDSFGLLMPVEVQKDLSTSGKQIVYSIDEIQERDSVLCGYWCLYCICLRDNEEHLFWMLFIMQTSVLQIRVSITHS